MAGMRRSRLRIVSRILLVIGAALIAASLIWPARPLTASEVQAIVDANLSIPACLHGSPLQISVPWHGRIAVVSDDAPSCGQEYVAGDQVVAYVGSDSPSDVGPTAQWILEPDSHDPFTIGDGNVQDIATGFGFWILVAGAVTWIVDQRRRKVSRQSAVA